MQPYDDLLVWQQYLRHAGYSNDILVSGFLALVQSWSTKRVKAEKVFPHLSPTFGLPLEIKIKNVFKKVKDGLLHGR